MAKSRLPRALIEEMYMTLSAFSRKESFLGYIKLSITRDLFKDENEYNEFYELFGAYHDVMIRANQTYTQTLLQELENAFNVIAERFPEQTDRFILETIYDARDSKRVPASLSYMNKRNVVSTKFTIVETSQRDNGIYAMGALSSSTIHRYLDDGKLNKSEQYFYDTFCVSEKGRKMLERLSAADFARCAQDIRMMPAIYFSINHIMENIEGEERLNLITQHIFGDLRNFNLDRFKLILYYKTFEEMKKSNEFTTENIDFLEALRHECNAIIPSAPLSLDEVSLDIPDFDASDFKINLISATTGMIVPLNSTSRSVAEQEKKTAPAKSILAVEQAKPDLSKFDLPGMDDISKRVNNTRAVESSIQDFPTFAVTTDNAYVTRTVVLPDEGVISKRTILQEMDDLLLALKFDQVLKIYDNNPEIEAQLEKGYKYATIKECLKGVILNKENLNLFAFRILEKVKFENLECDSKELESIFKEEKRNVINYLFKEKIFSLAVAIEFDFELVALSIKNNELSIGAEDLIRTRLSPEQKAVFINMAIQNKELLHALINSNSIARDDLFNLELNSYAELTSILFNRNILNIDDLVILMKQGKITLSDIENFDLENIQIDNSLIISKYSEIFRKRTEYELAAKENYEAAMQEGIDEEDIKESEKEARLREELQELTYFKDVYITLFKKQKISKLEEYHRRQDIYMDVIEYCYADEDFENSIASVTNMLYADDFISMAQVQQFDDSLFIPILKSGMAKRDDIERFKSEIVSVEEIDKIRSELSSIVQGEELEEEVRKQVYVLTYNKLSALMDRVISDPNSTKEEKLSILYSIFYKNNVTEKTHREFFETEILVKIYAKLRPKRKPPIIDPDDELDMDGQEEEAKEPVVEPGKKYSSREFVYPTNIIWKFIELLDSDAKFRILADGYVVFESEKLNKAFIENVWQANKEGDFVRRGYGTTTLILDLPTYKMHQADIIRPGRHGYKVDVLQAKSYLPRIQTAKGPKTTGMIIHEKDLKNTGKKIWFELILDHLGITQTNINNRTTVYTQEDLDKINSFILNSKTKYEEISK